MISSIKTYHEQLYSGKTSCTETVQHFLSQIKKKQQLNAFIEVWEDEALQRAGEIDKKLKTPGKKGKLFGVVIGIKDVICYKDHTVTASSKILSGFRSVYSSTVVDRLLAEDAIIIGRQNCDEFAMGSSNENSFYGNVLNAIDETRVPGGSSGGSAVAVQAGLCMISLGSDTGGSVRQPADFCGIIGMKPTYGRISRHGLIAYASSFDQVGIFGNTIEDVALILEVIAGADEFDSTVSTTKKEDYSGLISSNKKYKIAYFKETLEHESADAEISSTIKNFIEQLKKDGHTVEAVEFDMLDYIIPAYYVMTTAEASSNLSRYDGVKYGYRAPDKNIELGSFYKKNRSEGFGAEVKRRIMLGTFVLSAGYYDAYFSKAQKVRRLLVEKTSTIFNSYDALIMPTVPSTAWKFGEKSDDPVAMYLADIYTVFANLTGIPAISLPLFKHSNGLPFGLQLMTKQFDEVSLLNISQLWMQQYKKQ